MLWICMLPKAPCSACKSDYSVYSSSPSCRWSCSGISFIMSPASRSLPRQPLWTPAANAATRVICSARRHPRSLVRGLRRCQGWDVPGEKPLRCPTRHQKPQSCLFHYHFSELVPTAAFIHSYKTNIVIFPVLLLTHSGIVLGLSTVTC